MEKQIFDDIYSGKNYYKLIFPFTETLLCRVNMVANFYSNFFQQIIHYTDNNFEIVVWVEKLNSSKPRFIERLKEIEIRNLFIQFIIVYEFNRKMAVDFINFKKFSFHNGNLKFSICLEQKCKVELRYIVGLFNKNKFFKDLDTENFYKIFENCLKKQKFEENSFYLYKYSEFTSNILNLFKFENSQVRSNVKILVNTENIIQDEIIETKIVQHSLNNEVFLLNNIGKSESIQKAICKFLSITKKEFYDFDEIFSSIQTVLDRSGKKLLIIMTNRIKYRKDVELIKYLLDCSNLSNIALIVFENNTMLDFDLILNEKPKNLFENYFKNTFKDDKSTFSKIECNILKKFEVIFIPIPIKIISQILTKKELDCLDQLKKRNFIQLNSEFIYLKSRDNLDSLNITVNEELKILKNGIEHINSEYLKLKYCIAIKDFNKVRSILSSRSLIDHSEEYRYFEEIKSLLVKNIIFLSTDVQLLRLLILLLINERDLNSAKYIIQKYKEKDPLFFHLKLAFIYKLEKDYKKMEKVLSEIKEEVTDHLRDELFYLKFILFEKASDIKTADTYLKKIKNEYFICLANFQLSDRLIYRGEFKKAKIMLLKTTEYLKEESCYSDELEAYCYLAKLLREEGGYGFAEKVYKNIYIKSEIRKYELLSAFIGVDIGNFYLKLDDFFKAEIWYIRALKIFQKCENINGVILVQSNLVDIYKIKGQWEEAEQYLKAALRYDKDKKLTISLAVDLYNIAHLEYLKRNFCVSSDFLERSLKVFENNNVVNGITECIFLRLCINLFQNHNTSDLSVLRKYKKYLNHDQKILLTIFEKITDKYYSKNQHLLINETRKIESKIVRFNIVAIIIEKFSMKNYLNEFLLLSKALDRKNMNYYYYEFYWIYFNIHYEFEELKKPEYDIFIEMYYFFLRNKRIINHKILSIKRRVDKQNSIKDFLLGAEIFGNFLKWKLPEDFFKSFCEEIRSKININFIRLQIFKNKELIFDFSDSCEYKDLSQEIISLTMHYADPQNLTLEDIKKKMKSKERFCFPYENTKVIFWKISDDIFSILLVAFKNDDYYNVDVYKNYIDLFIKFGSLFSKFYEDEYAVNKKLNFIIGESVPIKKLKKKIVKVSKVDFSLLITGESGSGKELVARAVHLLSKRSRNAFVPVNSAAIPENLLEAELFGYKKGAFTGANEDRIGLIESANKGTFFLDEIADIPLILQSKLLRVLQENEIRRLGGNTIRNIDIRLISATNKNILDLIKENQFREDLYFRIQDLMIEVPPLRERIEDIPLLIQYFLKKYGFEIKDKIELYKLIDYLKSFRWKGNIRELESYIKRMITFYPDLIQSSGLYESSNRSLKEAKSEFERLFIVNALKTNNWNKVKTANQLKISRVYLFDLIKKYKLENEDKESKSF